MSVRIIVDSTLDLPKSLIEHYNFKIVPLSVHFGEKEYLDGVDITSSQFYDKLINAEEMPTTSQVPPERFIQSIKEELDNDNEVVIITIGSKASGTCQSAHIAVEEIGTDRVTIIDSNCLCMGTGFVAIVAAELLSSGLQPSELEEALRIYTNNGIEHLFCVDSLKYLRKGGRIKATQAVVGEVLNIKPVLNVENAITQTIHKVRGRKKIIPFYIQKMKDEMDYSSPRIILGHAQDEAFAKKLAKAIENELDWYGEIIISEIGAIIGAHAGPGVLACFYKKRVIE